MTIDADGTDDGVGLFDQPGEAGLALMKIAVMPQKTGPKVFLHQATVIRHQFLEAPNKENIFITQTGAFLSWTQWTILEPEPEDSISGHSLSVGSLEPGTPILFFFPQVFQAPFQSFSEDTFLGQPDSGVSILSLQCLVFRLEATEDFCCFIFMQFFVSLGQFTVQLPDFDFFLGQAATQVIPGGPLFFQVDPVFLQALGQLARFPLRRESKALSSVRTSTAWRWDIIWTSPKTCSIIGCETSSRVRMAQKAPAT